MSNHATVPFRIDDHTYSFATVTDHIKVTCNTMQFIKLNAEARLIS